MSIELNRPAFEAFAQRNEFGTYRTDRKGDGYDSSHTQLMWMAWCAAIQQAESAPVAKVELMTTGGNAGLATRIVEIDDHLRERLQPGQMLYTHPAPGVPVAWNSIQIASWIGSQLMHEPSMFERATVCKFVRSLGRHPTLLKHSPKLHAAPSVPDDVVRDAISTVREQYRGTDLGKAAEGICDAIDAAMLAAQAQKGD